MRVLCCAARARVLHPGTRSAGRREVVRLVVLIPQREAQLQLLVMGVPNNDNDK